MTGEDKNDFWWDTRRTLELLSVLCTIEVRHIDEGVPQWERPTQWIRIANMMASPLDSDVKGVFVNSCCARFDKIYQQYLAGPESSTILDPSVRQKLDEYFNIILTRPIKVRRLEIGAGLLKTKIPELSENNSRKNSSDKRTAEGSSKNKLKRKRQLGQDKSHMDSSISKSLSEDAQTKRTPFHFVTGDESDDRQSHSEKYIQQKQLGLQMRDDLKVILTLLKDFVRDFIAPIQKFFERARLSVEEKQEFLYKCIDLQWRFEMQLVPYRNQVVRRYPQRLEQMLAERNGDPIVVECHQVWGEIEQELKTVDMKLEWILDRHETIRKQDLTTFSG